ncbi:GGDEF domain-containing protein [Caldimonas thermodepolymerans]|uniref:GGDEF domain-containing protein n=1 Tax=Caldimonas thermodepolymerans TaxID=215580 RepID=UPI0024926C8E|nr:GGDEF domain-containing protein [Caldimonas thermodepolymerans]
MHAWLLGLGLERALAVLMLVAWAAALLVTCAVLTFSSQGSLALGLTIASVCVLTITPVLGYVVLKLVYELEASREQIRLLAITDDLTESYNRRHFMDVAEAEFVRSRVQRLPMGLLLIDADHFKRVNDTHGHQCGDTLLREIALACRGALRGSDVIARFGGEELIVLLPHTDLAGAMAIAERIRRRVARLSIGWRTERVEATVSLGVAALRPDTPSLDALIHEADQALYDAKRKGRNQVASRPSAVHEVIEVQAT